MKSISSDQPSASSPAARPSPLPDDFIRAAIRLETAGRCIAIANGFGFFELFGHEMQTARVDAATARELAASIDDLNRKQAREQFEQLEWSAANVEDHAWRAALLVADLTGEASFGQVPNGELRGPLMQLIAMAAAGQSIPQSLRLRCLISVGANRLTRALSA